MCEDIVTNDPRCPVHPGGGNDSLYCGSKAGGIMSIAEIMGTSWEERMVLCGGLKPNDPAIFSSNFSVKAYSVLLPAVVTDRVQTFGMLRQCSVPPKTNLLPFKSCYDTGSRRWKAH